MNKIYIMDGRDVAGHSNSDSTSTELQLSYL